MNRHVFLVAPSRRKPDVPKIPHIGLLERAIVLIGTTGDQLLLFNNRRDAAIVGDLTHTETREIPSILLACHFLVGLLILGWLLWCCNYTLDFTDESFYLFNIAYPEWTKNPLFLFGYFYHYLYVMLDHDIVLLRQSNIIITFLLAWGACSEFLGTFNQTDGDESRQPFFSQFLPRAILAFSLASGGLLVTRYQLTPGYNDLNKYAMLIAVIGCIRAGRLYTYRSISGWVLIGISGYISFLAKPSSSVAMGIILLGYLLLSKSFNWKLQILAIAVFFALLLPTEIMLHGSLSAAFDNTRKGLALLFAQAEAYTGIFRFGSLALLFRIRTYSVTANLFIITLLLILFRCLKSNRRSMFFSFFILAVGIVLIVDSMYSGVIVHAIRRAWRTELPPAVMAWQLGVFMVGVVAFGFGWKIVQALSKRQWALLLCLLFLPYVFAVGTLDHYVYIGSYVAFFVLMGVLIIVFPVSSQSSFMKVFLFIAAFTQLLTIINISISMESPFRQTHSYREMHGKLEVQNSSSPLFIEQERVEFITNIRKVAADNGFVAKTPIINTSLYGIGILYLLDGYSAGGTWTLGSAAFFESLMKQEPQEQIARAWILADEKEDSSTTLEYAFPNWKSRYQLVGVFPTSEIPPENVHYTLMTGDIPKTILLFKPIPQ